MSASESRLLFVDDDPFSMRVMSRMLAQYGNQRFATSGEAALRLARESTPDLILLDAEMPGMHGFEVLAAMKAEPAMADVPVIIVTSHADAEFEVTGFDMGAADFITKPVGAPQLQARVKAQLRVKRMADELRHISSTDGLTCVANRRRFDDAIESEWMRCRRVGDPISLLFVDIDHFKAYNDHYGHPAGDAALRSVAAALVSACMRPADLVARYGGEEFVLLLPLTARAGAQHVAQRVLDAVDALHIRHEASTTAPGLTVSVGVAFHDEASACWTGASAESRFGSMSPPRSAALNLMRAADQALYAAKRAGRAQARLQEIADLDETVPGRDLAAPSCPPCAAVWTR
jgi:diguanylate cyclase (GGDEF)-like protein